MSDNPLNSLPGISPNKIHVKYQPIAGKQKQFHSDRYKYFARLISAGTGAGKTKAGWYETFLWATENPGCVGYIFEPDYKKIRRILLPAFRELFEGPLHETHPLISEYSRTEGRFTWFNGSTTWFMGLDDPESAEGGNIDYAWPDEFRLVGGPGPSGPRKRAVALRTIRRRLRGSVAGKYPVGLWVTTTPDAPGSVLHKTFEDPKTRIKNSKIYRWSIYDNPVLTQDYVAEIVSSHSDGLAERFIFGRFATVATGSFGFDYSVHVFDDSFPVPGFKQIVYGVDFGWSNPSCILIIKLDGDGRAYVLDEFYKTRTTINELINEAKKFTDIYGKGYFICDPTELQTIQTMKEAGVNAKKIEIKRADGIREVGGRFNVQGDDKPRLYIHERCEALIGELQVYDENKKEYDHAVDALRYALSSLMKTSRVTVGSLDW